MEVDLRGEALERGLRLFNMMKPFTCRQCGGRGTLSNPDQGSVETCYVCHGKGKIEITPIELAEYFLRLKKKRDA